MKQNIVPIFLEDPLLFLHRSPQRLIGDMASMSLLLLPSGNLARVGNRFVFISSTNPTSLVSLSLSLVLVTVPRQQEIQPWKEEQQVLPGPTPLPPRASLEEWHKEQSCWVALMQ